MEQQGGYKGAEGKKIVLIGLGLTAAGILGFWGYNEYKKWKISKEEESDPENLPSYTPNTTKAYLPAGISIVKPKGNDEFPLKAGSKGERVKQLQETLIAKYGKSILPKYGADGDFGKETTAALKTKGLPEVIDENAFNVLVKMRSFDAKDLAAKIHRAATSVNFNEAISALKQMKSTDDYSAVNENFKQLILRGVRQTLVNGLLTTFSGDSKQKIQLEFLRMGLKYDGSKWALSGIEPLRKIITIRPALVWKNRYNSIKVPCNTILGYEIRERCGYCLFQSIYRQRFVVRTDSIKYI